MPDVIDAFERLIGAGRPDPCSVDRGMATDHSYAEQPDGMAIRVSTGSNLQSHLERLMLSGTDLDTVLSGISEAALDGCNLAQNEGGRDFHLASEQQITARSGFVGCISPKGIEPSVLSLPVACALEIGMWFFSA